MKTFISVFVFTPFILTFIGSHAQNEQQEINDFPILKGPYLGQKPPGMKPEIFAPGIVSRIDYFEHSSIYLTPKMDEMYWIADSSSAKDRKVFYIKMENGNWTLPKSADFCEHYSNSNLSFSEDGSRLYFTSRIPMNKANDSIDIWKQVKDPDIWYVNRTKSGWSEPINLSKIINTDESQALGIILKNGTVYYSDYNNIFRSELKNDVYQKPEKLEYPINTDEFDLAPFVSDDESYMIFESMRQGGFGGADLYVSFKGKDGEWMNPINLGPNINSGGHERSPYVSPDKKFLFFWRVTDGSDIYWVSAKIIEELKPGYFK